MNDERFKRGLDDLSKATLPGQAFGAWCSMGNSKDDKFAIISLPDYKKNIYPDELRKYINSEDSPFVPYFESGQLYFLDDELLAEMVEKNGSNVEFPIDYSIMLDTNYSSYIDKFVNNNDLSSLNNEIYNTIDILIRENFQFDYIFYMIENYKNTFLNSGLGNTFTLEDRKAALHQNLVSLELFKNIDKDEYCSSRVLKYKISKQEARVIVDEIFSDIFNSNNGQEAMKIFLDMHKNLVLFIIGVLRIRFQSKSSYHHKTKELFEYMDSTLGIFFQREMIIAHKYFMNPLNVQLINKVNKGMTKDNLLRSIENFAWDFASPRIMEIFLKTSGEGRYLIPFFLSNDKNLRNLLKLFKVKGVMYHKDDIGVTPIPSQEYLYYFQKYEPELDLNNFFSSEATKNRHARLNINKKNNFSCIQEEFNKLAEVMECK